MGAAAKLQRIGLAGGPGFAIGAGTHGYDADLVTILFTKQRAGADFLRFVRRHQPGGDLGILTDIAVHFALDAGDFVLGPYPSGW